MSKITFRADGDLVDAVEALDASKSEVMRDALRTYLEDTAALPSSADSGVVAEADDALVDRRLGAAEPSARDVNVRVFVESATETSVNERAGSPVSEAPTGNFGDSRDVRTERAGQRRHVQTCGKCGDSLATDHVYCPNCGEKAANRVFCECGDELRADWAFCPHCGRRTATADALEK